MAVRTNYITNPNFNTDLAGWVEFNKTTGQSSWWDQTNGLTLRVNNTAAAYYGRMMTRTLPAGTYSASATAQVLSGTTDVMFAVRKQGESTFLVEKHWTAPNNSFTRQGGTFVLPVQTTVEILCTVGSPAHSIIGSARFDKVLLTEGTDINAFFDGDTADTADVTYAWSGTANNSQSTATDGVVVTPPTGNGWELVEANDFEGTALIPGRFYVYNGFVGTNGCGTYSSARTTVHDGSLHLSPVGDSIPGIKSNYGQKTGAWEMGVSWNAKQGYKLVIFLWPDARPPDNKEHWSDGELDYFECIDTSGNSFAVFFHNSAGTPSKNEAFDTSITLDVTEINKVRIEWLEDSATVIVNDIEVFTTSNPNAIPIYSCHWVAQMDVGVPNAPGSTKSNNSVSIRPSYPTAYTGSDIPAAEITYLNIYKVSDEGAPPTGGGNEQSLGVTEVGPTNQDEAKLIVPARLQVNEINLPETTYGGDPWGTSGWPGALDEAHLQVEKFLAASETTSDADSATLTVPGQPDTPPPTVPSVVVRGDRWVWLSSNKQEKLELTSFIDKIAVQRGAAGLFGPPSEISRRKVPGQAGAITNDIKHGVRKVALPLVTYGGKLSVVQDIINKMVRLMDPVTNDAVLQYIARDGHVSELSVQCTDGLEGADLGSLGPTAQFMPVAMEAEDPYWYRNAPPLSFKGVEPTSWFPIFREDGEWLCASSVIGETTVTTKSDVNTWPLWTIVGPGADPKLINRTTGKVLSFEAELEEGETITIDTRPRGANAKTVKGPDGSNWFSKLVDRSLWPLVPGRNDIELVVVGSAPETYVSLSYRDATLVP